MPSVLSLFDIHKPRANWKKWMEDLTPEQKRYIEKIRKSYADMEYETGIKVIEVILPKSPQGLYWMDYPLEYARSLYPNLGTNGKAYAMVIFKIDEHKHIEFQGLRSSVVVQHTGIKQRYKKNFEHYIKEVTNRASMSDPKLTWGLRDSDLIYFYL